MCYQTRQIRTVKDLELRYDVGLFSDKYRDLFNTPQHHLNGFDHPNMLVIPQERPEVLAPGIWGIVPDHIQQDKVLAYYKESVKYGSGLNAQSEKLFNHFIYSHVALTQRCIIPVTGFFEPHTHKSKKYPFYIHAKNDETLSLAGIYTRMGNFVTFSILTKKASPLFERIHNLKKRQPVILPQNIEKDWLNNELSPTEVSELIATDYPEKDLEAYPVSKDLYSRKVNSNVASIADKVEYPELDDFT